MEASNIDKQKPELKQGEILCDGCWAVGKTKEPNWQFFSFKNLKSVWICPTCRPKLVDDLVAKQRAGL